MTFLPRQGGRELLCDGDNPSWCAGRSRVTVAEMLEPCRHDLCSTGGRCDECGEVTE